MPKTEFSDWLPFITSALTQWNNHSSGPRYPKPWNGLWFLSLIIFHILSAYRNCRVLVSSVHSDYSHSDEQILSFDTCIFSLLPFILLTFMYSFLTFQSTYCFDPNNILESHQITYQTSYLNQMIRTLSFWPNLIVCSKLLFAFDLLE